jgi:hypothetical protein
LDSRGCTTVSDWFFTSVPIVGNPYPTWSSIESSRPQTYMIAFNDYGAILSQVTAALPTLHPAADRLDVPMPLAAECLAIVAMNPAIPEDLGVTVLGGDSSLWRQYLAQIWLRFRRLRDLHSADILRRFLSTAIHPIPVRLEQEFDRCLFGLCVKCRGSYCGIQAEPAFMLSMWCQQHAPQLMEFVRLSSDRRLRTLLDGSDMAP